MSWAVFHPDTADKEEADRASARKATQGNNRVDPL